MHYLKLFVLLFMFAVNCSQAQPFNPAHFDHYTTANGLSHNTVTGIAQDATGYVWISTAHGLNRFNGSQFVKYYSNGNELSPATDEQWQLTWLDKSRLAVVPNGVHVIDTRTGKRRNVLVPYHQLKYQFKYNMIEWVTGDNQGQLYVLSRSGFYHFDSAYKLVSRYDYYTDAEVPLHHFYFGRGLFELDEHRLFIVSVAGIYIYDKRNKKLERMKKGDSPMLDEFLDYPQRDYQFYQPKPGQFFVLKTENDSLLYINIAKNKKVLSRLPFQKAKDEFAWRSRLIPANDSLYYLTGHQSGFFTLHFDAKSGRILLSPEKHFAAFLCSSLLQDQEQNLWVATNKGLFRQNPARQKVQTASLPAGIEERFPNIRVDDIWTSKTTVYAGGRSDGGLFLFNKKTFQLEEHILFPEKDGRNNIRAIAKVDSHHLLLGTHGPLVLFNTRSRKAQKLKPKEWTDPGDWTAEVFRDSKEQIWISSKYVYQFNTQKKTFNTVQTPSQLLSIPYSIDEDTSGNIWMAGHGLARYNTKQKAYDLLIDSFPFIKMPDKQVGAMTIDGNNRIWFGSANNGLIGYDIATKKRYHFTRNYGLPDNNILTLMVVGNQLWIACFSGVACLDLQSLQIRQFGKEDGFPDLPIAKGARFYYDEEDNLLYLCFSTVLARFDPQALLSKTATPRTFIESVVVNANENFFIPQNQITTSWPNNELTITIGTVNFNNASLQRFAYRLADDDGAWTQLGNQPTFSVSALSPGRHRLQVKCFSENQRWPEQIREMTIVVLPPFWLRPWFLALLCALFVSGIYLLIRWRINVVRRKEMIKTQIEKLKADDYKNQFELEQITNYFSSSLADKKTEEEVLWDVSKNLIGRLNYEDCVIYLWNEDKSKLLQKAAYGPKGQPEVIATNVFEVEPGQGVVGDVALTRRPVLIPDTRRDSRYRVDDDFRLSELTVPIIHNDELLGIIDSEHHQVNYFSERDVKILTTIATLLGNKLKQLESVRSLEAKKEELATINEQLAEARLSALQAQMNPHFVFNALNSIKRMILDGDNERASRYLSKFALMIRMTLEQSKEVFITLEENIAYLKAYLEMEQLRFDDSFRFQLCVDKSLETSEILIPSMALQPIVENAIWHGLMQAEGEKKLSITFRECENQICCTIEDNGIGIRQSEVLKKNQRPLHRSVGLENLRKRINIMNEKYAFEGSLRIEDLGDETRNQTGTRAVFQFNSINA